MRCGTAHGPGSKARARCLARTRFATHPTKLLSRKAHHPRADLAHLGTLKAYDASQLAVRLKSTLSTTPSLFSSSSAPVYVDLPGVAASSRTRTRQSAAPSLFDYLNPASNNSDADQVAAILTGQKGRTVKSAAAVIERLRIVKSEAESRVMRKAADISCEAHSQVSDPQPAHTSTRK